WADPTHTPLDTGGDLILEGQDPTDTRSDHDRDAGRIDGGLVAEAGVGEGLLRRGQADQAGPIDPPGLAGIDDRLRIEIGDRGREGDRVVGRVPFGYGGGCGTGGENVLEGRLGVGTGRGYGADAGDDHPWAAIRT